jgi:hypothetical protein
MSREQTRASISEVVAQVVSDEDLSNLNGDIPVPEQMEPDSMNILCVNMELQKPYRVVASGDDHMQLATPSNSIAYLVPQTK